MNTSNPFSKGARPTGRFYFAFGVMLMILLARLFYLQVIMGEHYQGLSSRNHIRIVTRPAPRGFIFDRSGNILADNYPVFSVALIPAEFDSTQTKLVAELLRLDPDTITARVNRASSQPYKPFSLVSNLNVVQISSLAENLYRIGGVLTGVVPRRRYPMGNIFAHLVGYVGEAEGSTRYAGELVGRSGLEMSLDEILSGEPGFRSEIVDAMGRIVDEFKGGSETDPVPGKELVLTIDANLTGIVDSLLTRQGLPGAAVILNYETGELLCVASWPAFNPNHFVEGLSLDAWNRLRDDPRKPMMGRAWSAVYPPASTYKIITAAYLLENNYVDKDYLPEPCYGSYELGGTTFRCWCSHGRVNIVEALAQSCDVYFYRTIQLGDMDEFAEFARLFGLGSVSPLNFPGESRGLVPDTKTMDEMYGSGGWGLGNLVNMSIGQGELLVTPLQMALVTGIIASDCRMPEPVILAEDVGNDRAFVDLELSPETIEILKEGMRRAVLDSRGTLHSAMSRSPLDFYGKSGTAESPSGTHSWFIGFLEEPEPLAISLIIEGGGSGGTVAAPLAETILRLYLLEDCI